MTKFESSIGVSKFAQMIRDAGGSIANDKLLGISQSGGFAGYHIYIYRGAHGNIEGHIAEDDARRWIDAHSVEAVIKPEYLIYAQTRSETTARA